MNELIAASRQALKVLEDFVDDPRCQKEIDQSSIALRTAIEAAEKHKQEPVTIDGNTSDGYHTFNELYEFRKAYNAALFNEWAAGGKCSVHKSWRHHDGELCFGGGWFIVVAVLPDGQISNHYEAKDWSLFAVPETERALFEFDGHTGSDVVSRLKSYTPPAAPMQEPPPECQTEAEKRAYAFGWWKALEANRAAPVQEPVEWLTGCPECGMDSGCDCDSGTWNPPAAPVQEQSRSEKLREAGFTRRPKAWSKDEEAEEPAAPVQKPLTDEQILEHFRETIDTGSLLSFADGVRFAEAAHGIKEKNT